MAFYLTESKGQALIVTPVKLVVYLSLIIKNITLFVALSMPFGASAWKWSDVCKNAKINLEEICKFGFYTSVLTMFSVASIGTGNAKIILNYQDMMKMFKDNPEKIAEWTAAYQEAIKKRAVYKNIMLISLPICVLTGLVLYLFGSFKPIEPTESTD